MKKGGDYEYFMDCQYEYVFAGDFDYYGFLSHHAVERIDPLAEEGIEFYLRISD